MKIKKKMFALLIFTLPMTSVFEITDKTSLPLFIGVICLMLYIKKVKFYIHDTFFLLFIISMMLNIMINNAANERSIFYVVGFLSSYLVYLKVVSCNYIKYKQLILRVTYFSTIIVSLYIIYEFICRNFYPGLFFDLPRVLNKEYNATFIGKYYRARGFCSESGHTALFYEFVLPFNIYYIFFKKSNIRKAIFLVIVLVSLIFIYSSMALAIMGTALMLALFIYIMKRKKNIKSYLIILGLIVLLVACGSYLNNASGDLKLSIGEITNKMLLTNESQSATDRKMRVIDGYSVIKNNIIWGIGPMMLSNYTGFDTTLNMPMDLILYSGFFGAIFFCIYILIFFIKIINTKDNFQYCMFFSFFMVMAHYQIITNFYYPWIWVLLGIIEGESSIKPSKDGKSRLAKTII